MKILDALRRCEKGSIAVCRGCSYWDTCESSPYAVTNDAADLIERQEARIAELNGVIEGVKIGIEALRAKYGAQLVEPIIGKIEAFENGR